MTELELVAAVPANPRDRAHWTPPRPGIPHRTRTGHVLGATYASAYWRGTTYTVVGEDEHGAITVVGDDGRARTHRTSRGGDVGITCPCHPAGPSCS